MQTKNRLHIFFQIVAALAALAPFSAVSQAQNSYQRELMCPSASAVGTDSYACNLYVAPTAYVNQREYAFTADVANTGGATVNIHGLGVKTIVKVQGGVTTALDTNDIRPGQIVVVRYDGTNMQMVSQLGNAPSGGSSSPPTLTALYWSMNSPAMTDLSTVALTANVEYLQPLMVPPGTVLKYIAAPQGATALASGKAFSAAITDPTGATIYSQGRVVGASTANTSLFVTLSPTVTIAPNIGYSVMFSSDDGSITYYRNATGANAQSVFQMGGAKMIAKCTSDAPTGSTTTYTLVPCTGLTDDAKTLPRPGIAVGP